MPDYGPGSQMFGAQSTMRERGRSAQRLDPVIGAADAYGGSGIGGAQPPAMGAERTDFDIQQLIDALKMMPAMGGTPTEEQRRQMMLEQTNNPTEMMRQQMMQQTNHPRAVPLSQPPIYQTPGPTR